MSQPFLNLLRRHAFPLVLALACLAVAIAGDDVNRLLRYHRNAILDGAWWRLFTAHLTHLGWSHLLLNLAGLGLVWILVGQAYSSRGWGVLLAGCALGTGLGLLALNPQLGWYVGLSGVLHGLLAAGAVGAWRGGQRDAPLLLAIVVGKLLWEQWSGPLPGSAEAAGGTVIVDAHLYGGLMGLLIAPWLPVRRAPQGASPSEG